MEWGPHWKFETLWASSLNKLAQKGTNSNVMGLENMFWPLCLPSCIWVDKDWIILSVTTPDFIPTYMYIDSWRSANLRTYVYDAVFIL